MALTLKAYTSAALTTQLTLAHVGQDPDNILPPAVMSFWLGIPTDGITLVAASDPGVDDIMLEVASTGAGEPTTSVKLALSEAGLATAVGGAALSLGTSIESGVDNAIQIWVKVDSVMSDPGRYTNLKFLISDLLEDV